MNFKINETEQKLRGGYYTPEILADFINSWILESKPENILEPSCGDGIFFNSLFKKKRNKNLKITAFEIDKNEAEKAENILKGNTLNNYNLYKQDFLRWTIQKLNTDLKFDAIVGNPPFIRYQYLENETQNLIEMIFKLLRIKFTKHTNLWVPFVLASIHFLKPGGRLGMVLPAEILHVMHAQALRTFLGQNCDRILIFDPEDLWFKNTLQGAIILFAEKKIDPSQTTRGLGIIKTKGYDFTKENPSKLFNSSNYINGKTIEGKWTYALLTTDEFNLIKRLKENKDVYEFKNIAKVDVGIVTGANKFFLVNNETVHNYNLEKYSHPMFGRSEHCPGVIYDKKQHSKNSGNGTPSNFIWFNVENKSELNAKQKEYLIKGESELLDTRYKCKVRKPWFRVPSVYATKLGMLKRAHDFPRLILNEIEAFTTDTAYRIKSKGLDETLLVFCFINSLTALTAELEGRHYGGGVLELVPSEIEKLLIPIPSNIKSKSNLKRLNNYFLNRIEGNQIIKEQDDIVLTKIGLTKSEIKMLQSARLRLALRRQRITE